MNIDKPQMPSQIIKKTDVLKFTRPDATVSASKETNVMHHDGEHVTLPGANRLSGKGKAGSMVGIFSDIKNMGNQ